MPNEFIPFEQVVKEMKEFFKQETERLKKLTPEERQAEIDAMPERDRFYIENGYYK